MEAKKKILKAIVVYIILFDLALIMSGFQILISKVIAQTEDINTSEDSVLSGMAFIGVKPKNNIVCMYFTGYSVDKTILNYSGNLNKMEKNICPFINKL